MDRSALIDMRHRNPERGRPGDRDWGADNARLVAAREARDSRQQGRERW